jgi:pimeloyl-ACP methyl ester carboxylesterase
MFDLNQRTTSPFPTNWLTTPDATQNTRRRVNLPMLQDCSTDPRQCADILALNELDGFSIQPRVSIPFDGDIDPNSVNSSNVFLVRLHRRAAACDDDGGAADDSGFDEGDVHDGNVDDTAASERIGTDQVVWDTASRSLHVETEVLEQHTRYAVIVSTGIVDANGLPIGASDEFKHFGRTVPPPYSCELREALRAARRAGVRRKDVAVATVFTTQSVTYRMEKIRRQLDAAPPSDVSFNLGPNGERTVFALDDIRKVTWVQHTRHSPDAFAAVNTTPDVNLLKQVSGAVAAIAYGKFSSPDYTVHPGEYMPAIGTRTGNPEVQSYSDVYVNIVVPSGPRPANGWPVAIFGTGAQGSKETWLHRVAATMADHGIATASIPFYANGTGPRAHLTIEYAPGGIAKTISFLSGGRAVDQNGDGVFAPNEGIEAATRAFSIGLRDSYQQSTVDRMVLARAIGGIDIDGDFVTDLDPSRIFYFGTSTGAQQGFLLTATDPTIAATVLTNGAGPLIVTNWWGNSRNRFGAELAIRGRLNPPGVTRIDGIPIGGPAFFDNVPLRMAGGASEVLLEDSSTAIVQAPVVNSRDGAMYVQELREWKKWLGMAGDPAGYAKHLRQIPLTGVPVRPFVYQLAIGDQTIPNPTALTLIRAGDFADRTSSYRHDLEFADNPLVAKDPHQILIRIDSPQDGPTSRALQDQIAVFFQTGETTNPRPRYFEAPIIDLDLLERLNYTR